MGWHTLHSERKAWKIQANWELVIMWVNDKQIVDVCDQINEISFELWTFPCYHEQILYGWKRYKSLRKCQQSWNDTASHRCSGGVVVREFASHQCGPGSISRLVVICGLSLLVLFSALRRFPPGIPVFPSLRKPAFPLWRSRGPVVAQLASVLLSEREVPSSILGDLNVCFDFPLIRVAFQILKKRSTVRGRGIKGAPSASIDTSFVTVVTTDVN